MMQFSFEKLDWPQVLSALILVQFGQFLGAEVAMVTGISLLAVQVMASSCGALWGNLARAGRCEVCDVRQTFGLYMFFPAQYSAFGLFRKQRPAWCFYAWSMLLRLTCAAFVAQTVLFLSLAAPDCRFKGSNLHCGSRDCTWPAWEKCRPPCAVSLMSFEEGYVALQPELKPEPDQIQMLSQPGCDCGEFQFQRGTAHISPTKYCKAANLSSILLDTCLDGGLDVFSYYGCLASIPIPIVCQSLALGCAPYARALVPAFYVYFGLPISAVLLSCVGIALRGAYGGFQGSLGKIPANRPLQKRIRRHARTLHARMQQGHLEPRPTWFYVSGGRFLETLSRPVTHADRNLSVLFCHCARE